ncbi:MAG: hypothetical protein AB2807_12365 [Candidatus Sedimenticola endophacoides]
MRYCTRREEQECRYLVKDFGTSQSPKSTRQRALTAFASLSMAVSDGKQSNNVEQGAGWVLLVQFLAVAESGLLPDPPVSEICEAVPP